MAGFEDSHMSAASKEARVQNDMGMHARPAAALAREAQKFNAAVRLIVGDQAVDAKSILDILSLALGKGSDVVIEAEGEDAGEAVRCLADFFDKRCGEDR